MRVKGIEVDKCYRTASGLVRLVTKIEGDDITFASRGAVHFRRWHDSAAKNLMSRRRFCAEATEEVPYHWEPLAAAA
jgi:hypothetical protein